MLTHIRDGTMPQELAERCLRDLAQLADKPYYERETFVRDVAAIVALHPQEVSKTFQKTGNLRSHLAVWCEATRLEWMPNCTRFLHGLPQHTRALMPSGTTSNEAYHAELNAAFKRVQSLHVSSLESRLKTIQFSKLLAHNSALYRPGLRQERAGTVLVRLVGALRLFDDNSWREWVDAENEAVQAAAVGLGERARLKEWKEAHAIHKKPARRLILKRPSGDEELEPVRRSAESRHRTPFSLRRPTRA